MKKYDFSIEGYWKYEDCDDLPDNPGVYFVYQGTVDMMQRACKLSRLLYIGKAEQGIRTRLKNHDKLSLWHTFLGEGEDVLISCTEVAKEDCARVEAAYIFKHKPLFNDKGIDSFNYPTTTIRSTGKTAKLDSCFTV